MSDWTSAAAPRLSAPSAPRSSSPPSSLVVPPVLFLSSSLRPSILADPLILSRFLQLPFWIFACCSLKVLLSSLRTPRRLLRSSRIQDVQPPKRLCPHKQSPAGRAPSRSHRTAPHQGRRRLLLLLPLPAPPLPPLSRQAAPRRPTALRKARRRKASSPKARDC